MKRIFLDIILLLLIILNVSFQFLPKILHELFGILILVAIISHLICNRHWFYALCRGRWNLLRIVSTMIDLLLLINIVCILSTGMMISNYLFKGMWGIYLQRNTLVHQLHVSLPYLLLVLVGLHLGLHWSALWQCFVNYCSFNRILKYTFISKFIVLLLIIDGIIASFMNQVGDRLQLKHIFATPATDTSLAVFSLLLLGIVGMYTVVGYWLQKSMRQ